ncbi:cytochrome c biogenesis protein ResB [Arthrobacter castelli]|uniref:cytochrome c biogenesis protein ResB n=1 Tax=Arthrobacter castelli TaxID=271431 RepID=UPI00040B975E|nr:cytochrome c biogenesis protein ResB [Arthrobacter castelli]
MGNTVKDRTGQEQDSSKPSDDVTLPSLGFVGTLRFVWRQLTSMRTALFLLLLLAVASVPGSLFPQRPKNPATVDQYIEDHPVAGPWLDRLQFFDVYSSVWFSAIYLLLFISLVGCVIPRAAQHAKAMRSKPPRTPRRLSRLPEYGAMAIPATAGMTPSSAIEDAAALLKKRGYRVQVRDRDTARPSVGAERGFLKEVGNLLFHFALIGVLISFAVSGMFGYRGQKILVEGGTFVNNLVSYDSFTPGTNFVTEWMDPFSIRLDDFSVTFERQSKSNYGQPLDFTAEVTTKTAPDAQPRQQVLEVNDPLSFNATNVYLVGNGYAPVVTVRDGQGNVALSEPVVAQVQDASYTSTIVIKAPDAQPSQLSFVGLFIPTAVTGPDGQTVASDPDPLNPQLLLDSYYGDLGLDKGVPTNVYTLDTTGLTQLNGRKLDTGGIVLQANETYQLPEGKGSITFEGLKRYIGVDITHDPGKYGALVFSSLAVLGLLMSLFIGRRRVWIRAGAHEDGRTMVEYGLLARGEDYRLKGEGKALRSLFDKKWLTTNPHKEQ